MKLVNTEVRIENTSKCNAACIICPREKMTRPKVTMETGFFVDLVNQAKDLGAETISIFGYGEPLCDDELIDKIYYCHAMGMRTFITTNAKLLTVELSHDLLLAGLSHIRFSAHGIGPNYDSVHRGLSWPDTLRNINNFLAINKTKFDGKCETDVSVIPMHFEPIEMFRDFWEASVDYLEIWKPHNWTDGRDLREVDVKKKSCGRPFNGPVQINADGKMMVCCFDFDAKLTIGDTRIDSIEAILKGEPLNEIRRKHKAGDLSGLICENCDQLNEYKDSPLLYSNRDATCEVGKTSSTKFKLKEL